MQENDKSAKAKVGQRNEVQELIERCKAMEKELGELKNRMLEIQRQVEGELKRRKSSPD
jgi:hypothetical protein